MRDTKRGLMKPFEFFACFLACSTAVLCGDASREALAITVHPGVTERIQLRSTDRLPDAAGEARVERKGGTTEIELNLDSMKPASLFGGDYNTYVLWVVPPQGLVQNLGELQLEGNHSRLHASTEAAAFALLVTAEPHYLVITPSPFVVLENKPVSQGPRVRYQLLEGVYNFERSSLADVKEAKGKVHTEVKQAFTAVRLAQRADAARLAPEELREAQRALDQTLNLWRSTVDRSEIAAQARETVRLALAAQHLAEDRAFQGARVEVEGSGGGNGEAGRRIPRDQR
jgi:hypothetical protein